MTLWVIVAKVRDLDRNPKARAYGRSEKDLTAKPNAKRPLSDAPARFREGIKGDGEDDNDADNDLLDIRRHVHQHQTVK